MVEPLLSSMFTQSILSYLAFMITKYARILGCLDILIMDVTFSYSLGQESLSSVLFINLFSLYS